MADLDRSKNWVGLWYPDDPTHSAALEKLQNGDYRFAAILHDKDIDENGERKKPHWHIVIVFRNQRTASAIAKEFGITENYLQPSRDRDAALRYLVHADDPDKYQYDMEEAFGSLASSIPQVAEKESEAEQVLRILSILDSMPVPCTYRKLLVACCNADLYATFRRMGTGIHSLLDEHNAEPYTQDPKTGFASCATYEQLKARAQFRYFAEAYHAGQEDAMKGGLV